MNNATVIEHHSSLDWQLSVKLANNNKQLAKDLLEMFMADLPKASDAIHHAYENKQYEELTNQVHKLHGASCYCGVTKLKALLAKMEFSAKEKLFPAFEALLREFDDEVNNVLSAYKAVEFA